MADNIATEIASAPQPPALSATSDMPVVTQPAPADTPADAAPPQPEAQPPAATEADAAEGADREADTSGQAAADADTTAEPPAKPDRSLAGRLSQRTRERNELREQNERLAGLLERALDRLGDKPADTRPAETKPADTPPPAPDPRPNRENFDDPDAYDTAVDEWNSRRAQRLIRAEIEQIEQQKQAQETERQTRERQEREAAQAQERWQGQVKELQADPQYADFDEVALNPELMIHQDHVPLIAQAGPKVLYWLGQNPDEAARIAKLDPISASFEIGAIRHQVSTARPPVSRAPPPVVPVRGENRAASKSPDEMTMEEYAASRMPEVQAERRNSMFGNRTH